MSWGVFDDDWERRKIDGDKSMNEVSDKSKRCFDGSVRNRAQVQVESFNFDVHIRSSVRHSINELLAQ